MNTNSTSCWICRSIHHSCMDHDWTLFIRKVLKPFQSNQITCQFIHHLHHMEFTSSSPFHIILEFPSQYFSCKITRRVKNMNLIPFLHDSFSVANMFFRIKKYEMWIQMLFSFKKLWMKIQADLFPITISRLILITSDDHLLESHEKPPSLDNIRLEIEQDCY